MWIEDAASYRFSGGGCYEVERSLGWLMVLVQSWHWKRPGGMPPADEGVNYQAGVSEKNECLMNEKLN